MDLGSNSWLKAGSNFLIIFSFLVLLVKSWELGLIKHSYYRDLALNNKLYETTILAPRGSIYDRKDRVVAQSVYHYFRDVDGKVIYEGTDSYKGARFEEKGVSYELRRKYPYGYALGLVSGYVNKPKEAELSDAGCSKKLDKRSLAGRTGVEAWEDCLLRGTDGKRLVEVDAKGGFIRDMGRQEPVAGANLKLSIDAYWQNKAYTLLAGRKGAIVVSDPKTGKIIVLVSSPGFDPNDFSYQVDNAKIRDYLSNEVGMPLLNRAIGARYHPGSVFKMAVATAGLETGVVNSNTSFLDTGVLKVGEYEYKNWLWTKRGATDGMVDLVKGLTRSNDIYFYNLGEKLGPENIKAWALKFGFGTKTGIEIPGEIDGILPDPDWKKRYKKENWFLGNTYHMAIGQGDVDVTPLQVNEMTRAIANDGVLCKSSIFFDKKDNCIDLMIKMENLKKIKEGMIGACSPGGTAWPLFNFKTRLACKTGTAQVGDGSPDTHAWLTAFAPVDNPQIAITVLIERGGEGSDVAAPVVGDFLKMWLGEDDTKVPRRDEKGNVVSE